MTSFCQPPVIEPTEDDLKTVALFVVICISLELFSTVEIGPSRILLFVLKLISRAFDISNALFILETHFNRFQTYERTFFPNLLPESTNSCG